MEKLSRRQRKRQQMKPYTEAKKWIERGLPNIARAVFEGEMLRRDDARRREGSGEDCNESK